MYPAEYQQLQIYSSLGWRAVSLGVRGGGSETHVYPGESQQLQIYSSLGWRAVFVGRAQSGGALYTVGDEYIQVCCTLGWSTVGVTTDTEGDRCTWYKINSCRYF